MTIKIFIGTEPKTAIFDQVLEFSIRRHTEAPADFLQFTRMIGPEWEYPIKGTQVGTGFSLRRWMIPAACGWQGYAVYLDADQLVFDDILELCKKTEKPDLLNTKDPVIWCSWQPDKFSKEPWPQTSVMVINCERARGHWGFDIDRVLAHLRDDNTRASYAHFMHASWLAGKVARIGDEWNHLNKYVPKGKPKHTRLIHYTKEDAQPPYRPDLPLAKLWQKELEMAIKAGQVSREDFVRSLASWKKKDDWRPTNGLHPYYKKYLNFFRA